MVPTTAIVGRQPIMDREREVAGFELLFRPLVTSDTALDPAAPHRFTGDEMTNEVIFSALGIGVTRLAGTKPIFCNADRGVLTGQVPISLPPKQTVIEVLESVAIDDEVVAGLTALRRAGYRLAADDFEWFADAPRLLDLVDIVKIDLRRTHLSDIPSLMEQCRPYHVTLLAEKIETAAEYDAVFEMGFDLFQGYHLGRPATIAGPATRPSPESVVRLANAVMDPNIDYDELEAIIRGEPELVYQLLQLAAIGRFGETKRGVAGIRQALVWLGLNRLRGWIPALLLRPAGPAVETTLPAVLGRARLVELLAQRINPSLGDLAFTAGMVSAFDILLGVPTEKVAGMLELPPVIAHAAFNPGSAVGRLIHCAIDYEAHGAVPADIDGIDRSVMAHAAARAFAWAMRSASVVDRAA